MPISLNSPARDTDVSSHIPTLEGQRGGRAMNVQLPAEWVSIRRHEGGYCVEGPGFYVWDEDPREVSRTARALRRRTRPGLPAHRIIMVVAPESDPIARES